MPSADPPSVSALSDLLVSKSSQTGHAAPYETLALQIQYSLQYQHDWTALTVHTLSPLSGKPLPRPLISGLPPHRVYVHPDDQVEELKKGVKDGEVEVEREWVLPTNLKEKWSLKKFAEIFDAIGEQPPRIEKENGTSANEDTEEAVTEQIKSKKRRGGKRLLLATASDDSTVVYYIVHDGIVKPRQN